MYCDKCGKEIPADSAFCRFCGVTLPGVPDRSTLSQTREKQEVPGESPTPGQTTGEGAAGPPGIRNEPVIQPAVPAREVKTFAPSAVPPPAPGKLQVPAAPLLFWVIMAIVSTILLSLWWPSGLSLLSPLVLLTGALVLLAGVTPGTLRRILGACGAIFAVISIGIILLEAARSDTTYFGNVTYYGFELDTHLLVLSLIGGVILLWLSTRAVRRPSPGTPPPAAASGAEGPKKIPVPWIIAGIIVIGIIAAVIAVPPILNNMARESIPGLAGAGNDSMSTVPQDSASITTTVPSLPPGTKTPDPLTATPTRTIVVSTTRSSTSPPNAQFSTSTLSGNAPLTVYFSDDSAGFPTAWSWDFGDGKSASIQNPAHTYATAGTYSVRLSVTGPGGSSTSYPQQVMVYAGTPITVEAMFSADPSTGVAPLAVLFTDLSSGTLSSRNWDFGDGGTSALTSPVHTYTTPGQYTARLTVRSSSGVSSTAISPITVNMASTPAATTTAPTPVHTSDDIYGTTSPTKASFTYTPDLGPVPLVVRFQDTSTGSPTTWRWDFGDGTTSNLKNPVHTYSLPGDYVVLLSITSPTGGSQLERGPISVFYKL